MFADRASFAEQASLPGPAKRLVCRAFLAVIHEDFRQRATSLLLLQDKINLGRYTPGMKPVVIVPGTKVGSTALFDAHVPFLTERYVNSIFNWKRFDHRGGKMLQKIRGSRIVRGKSDDQFFVSIRLGQETGYRPFQKVCSVVCDADR